jgi:hypothetical protein
LFVEEELQKSYHGLISFVQETETKISSEGKQTNLDAAVVVGGVYAHENHRSHGR